MADSPPRPALQEEHYETELKYVWMQEDFPAAWVTGERLAPGWRLGDASVVRIRDWCLDTRDFVFLRSGFVLRLRVQEDGSCLLGLKELAGRAVDGAVQRWEEEWPLTVKMKGLAAPPLRLEVLEGRLGEAGAPAPLDARLRARKGSTRLWPLLRLDQLRRKRLVYPEGELSASPVAELSLDVVHAFPGRLWGETDAPADEAGAPVGRWRIVEVERLGQEGEGVLPEVGAHLAARKGLTLERRSKPILALQALADAEGLRGELHMAEAGRLLWRQQLAALLLPEAAAWRGDDPEAVHDMRVAIRRMRAAARVFGPFFTKKALRPHLKRLRKTARLLGAARDLDVGLAKLEAFRAERGDAGGLEEIAAHWRAARAEAYAQVKAWLDSDKYARFVAELADFCTTPGAGQAPLARGRTDAPRPHQVRHVMPGQILANFLTMRAYEVVVPVQEGAGAGSRADVETLHALRIDGKRLRYSLEFVRPLLGVAGQKLIKRLKRLQDVLGDLNDAAVAHEQVRTLQAEGLDGPGVRAYLAHQEEVIQVQRQAFQAVWRAFLARRNRRRLAQALAEM